MCLAPTNLYWYWKPLRNVFLDKYLRLPRHFFVCLTVAETAVKTALAGVAAEIDPPAVAAAEVLAALAAARVLEPVAEPKRARVAGRGAYQPDWSAEAHHRAAVDQRRVVELPWAEPEAVEALLFGRGRFLTVPRASLARRR